MSWPVSPERIARGLYWQEAWKLVEGCTPVSRGCDNCWSARETAVRAKHPNDKISIPKQGLVELSFAPGIRKDQCVKRDQCGIAFNGSIRLREDNLDKPLRAKKPRVYAVWNDLFHEDVPENFIRRMLDVIADCPQHIFLVLTKRPRRMGNFTKKVKKTFWYNVWFGVSVEDQKTADERIPLLFQTPAAKRFVSYEPALGPVDFTNISVPLSDVEERHEYAQRQREVWKFNALVRDFEDHYYEAPSKIDWLIMGGESGPGARPMNPEWARSARDQCQAAGVPFFFKQWGKKAAGCLLDGREWKELPRC